MLFARNLLSIGDPRLMLAYVKKSPKMLFIMAGVLLHLRAYIGRRGEE